MSKRRLAAWLNLILSSLLMLGVWGLLAVLSTRPAFKVLVDFSPQARFSVGPATEELMRQVRELDVKVEFHAVFEPLGAQNEVQQQYARIQQRLQTLTDDLLRQYEYLGGEAVTVSRLDSRRDLSAVRALLRGAERQSTNFVLVRVGDRSKFLSLFLDIGEIDNPATSPAAQLPGQAPQVPILKDFRGEEALSSAVKSLLVQGQPVVYFLTGDREAELEGTYGLGYSKLRQALVADGFLIRTLNLQLEPRIPLDADMLAMLEPRREILPDQAQLIADYVRGGGRVFINLSYHEQPPEWNPTLEPLGKLLGFEVGTELVCQLVPDPLNPNSPGRDGIPIVRNLLIRGLNPGHPITKPLWLEGRLVQVVLARELRRRAAMPDDLRADPSLLMTGQWTWGERRGPDGEVDYLAPGSAAGFHSSSVGMVIDVDAPGPSNGHVVLLSGVAFVNELLFERNSDLALNIFNFLAERPVSISVRSRAYQARDLQLAPQQLGRISWLLIGGVPIFLLILGIGVFWRRSRP